MATVSIITPVYNSEKFLQETADSIFGQTFQDWEWILVNDCSKDGSLDLIKSLANKDSRVKFLSNEENLNTARTRNRGIEVAEGRFLAFIDSDDIWHPKKLEKQINFMIRNEVAFSYHGYTKFYDSEKRVLKHIYVPERVNLKDMLMSCSVGSLTAMYDTHKVGKVLMPDGFRAREDYLCWLEILKKIDFAYGIQESLGYYRVLPSSYSGNKLKAAHTQWRVYREYFKQNLGAASLNFAHYALKGYLNHKS